MVERITRRQFHEAAGVEDWRVLAHGVSAHFRTGSFATGVGFIDEVGRLADARTTTRTSTCGRRG